MHQLNFSIPRLPCKWRVELEYGARAREGPSCFPRGERSARGVSILPTSLGPFLVTSTWLFEVFTYTHVVYQGDNLARGHLEVQSPTWSVLWTLSPPTQCLLDF